MSDAIWVNSDLAPDQVTYVAAVHFTEDISHSFPEPQQAVEYATTLLQAWGAAEYDAAVFAQLTTKLGMDKDKGTRLLAEFREQRGGPETYDVGPVAVTPGVSVFTGEPFVRCAVGDLNWQWDGIDVHRHVQHVLEVVSVVNYDTAYRAFLADAGIDSARALAAVEDIVNFRRKS